MYLLCDVHDLLLLYFHHVYIDKITDPYLLWWLGDFPIVFVCIGGWGIVYMMVKQNQADLKAEKQLLELLWKVEETGKDTGKVPGKVPPREFRQGCKRFREGSGECSRSFQEGSGIY